MTSPGSWTTGLALAVSVFVPLTLIAPQFVLVPVLVAALWGLSTPTGRLLWLVLGGMFVLQSSAGLSPPKLGYLAGVFIAALVAVHRWPANVRQPWAQPFRLVARGSWVLVAVLLLAAIVGRLNGAPFIDIGRDALTYALLLAGPPIALDASTRLSLKSADKLVLGIALLATVGFAIAWSSRRGVSQLSAEQFVLPSNFLMAIGVALAATRGLVGGRVHWGWLSMVPIIIAGQLVTGTRTGLLLVLGVVGILGSAKKAQASVRRLALGLGAAVVGLALTLPLLSSKLTSADFLARRIQDAQGALSGGWSSDQSGAIRLLASRIASDLWSSHYLFGVGFGYTFPDPNDLSRTTPYQIDTAYLLLAKFGLIGSIALIIAVALLYSPLRTATMVTQRHLPEQAILRGVVAVTLGFLIVGAPTEDKGFALTLPLALLLMGASLRTSGAQTGTVDLRAEAGGDGGRPRFSLRRQAAGA